MSKTKNSKHTCNDIQTLRDEFNGIPAFHGGDHRFIAQALMFLCEQLSRQPKRQCKSSAWNEYFGKGMKSGRSPAEIGRAWREAKQTKPPVIEYVGPTRLGALRNMKPYLKEKRA